MIYYIHNRHRDMTCLIFKMSLRNNDSCLKNCEHTLCFNGTECESSDESHKMESTKGYNNKRPRRRSYGFTCILKRVIEKCLQNPRERHPTWSTWSNTNYLSRTHEHQEHHIIKNNIKHITTLRQCITNK